MRDERPVRLGLAASFGFGDRTGLATPGHAEALKRAGAGILPIFAQQSIREMARTGRTPAQVMADACEGAAQAGYRGPAGADADHLKTAEDIECTAAAGFTFFTLDPSDFVDPRADDYPVGELRDRQNAVRDHVDWLDRYRDKRIDLDDGVCVELTDEACLRAAVKYGRAINHASELAKHVERVMAGRPFELELSVDETEQPTTPAEHWIIADQLRERGVKLISLAPRYVGNFEKAVDFKGNVADFERSLRVHAAIAQELGPYKLSLHSGSDKLSIYPSFARITGGLFHVKTAGTSYLEALRVAARAEPELFRRIVDFARSRYATDRATYHLSADPERIPAPGEMADDRELERLYLGLWSEVPAGRGFTEPGRQIVHCTFGSVLTHSDLGPALLATLRREAPLYKELLAEHFVRHLQALQA